MSKIKPFGSSILSLRLHLKTIIVDMDENFTKMMVTQRA